MQFLKPNWIYSIKSTYNFRLDLDKNAIQGEELFFIKNIPLYPLDGGIVQIIDPYEGVISEEYYVNDHKEFIIYLNGTLKRDYNTHNYQNQKIVPIVLSYPNYVRGVKLINSCLNVYAQYLEGVQFENPKEIKLIGYNVKHNLFKSNNEGQGSYIPSIQLSANNIDSNIFLNQNQVYIQTTLIPIVQNNVFHNTNLFFNENYDFFKQNTFIKSLLTFEVKNIENPSIQFSQFFFSTISIDNNQNQNKSFTIDSCFFQKSQVKVQQQINIFSIQSSNVRGLSISFQDNGVKTFSISKSFILCGDNDRNITFNYIRKNFSFKKIYLTDSKIIGQCSSYFQLNGFKRNNNDYLVKILLKNTTLNEKPYDQITSRLFYLNSVNVDIRLINNIKFNGFLITNENFNLINQELDKHIPAFTNLNEAIIQQNFFCYKLTYYQCQESDNGRDCNIILQKPDKKEIDLEVNKCNLMLKNEVQIIHSINDSGEKINPKRISLEIIPFKMNAKQELQKKYILIISNFTRKIKNVFYFTGFNEEDEEVKQEVLIDQEQLLEYDFKENSNSLEIIWNEKLRYSRNIELLFQYQEDIQDLSSEKNQVNCMEFKSGYFINKKIEVTSLKKTPSPFEVRVCGESNNQCLECYSISKFSKQQDGKQQYTCSESGIKMKNGCKN